jgi:mRNA interferase MazF
MSLVPIDANPTWERHEARRSVDGLGRRICGQAAPSHVQDHPFDATASVTICVFATDETEAPLFRLLIAPSERNGLPSASRLMMDKLTTVPNARLGQGIG